MTKKSKSSDDYNPFREDPSWDEPTARLWRSIVKFGDPAKVKQAIADGASLNAVNPRGVSLMLAAVHHDQFGHPIVTALLDAGVALVEQNGESPAMGAAKRFLDSGGTYRFLEARLKAAQEREALEGAVDSAPQRAAPRV